MSETSADHLIARLAPAVIDGFRGRGAIDFRVSPADPSRVHVCILFPKGVDHQGALAELKGLAHAAGLEIDGEAVNQHSISVRVAEPAPSARSAKPGAEIVILPAARRAREGRAPFMLAEPRPVPAHPARSVHRLLRRAATAWLRWRALLAPARLSQPAK